MNKENLPLYLKNFKITSKKELHYYSTGNSKLYIPNDRNNYNNLTVQLRALTEWNSLPSYLHEIKDRNLFKKELFKYFLITY